MARASTWSNSDGLVVGYGRNTPEKVGAVAKEYGGVIKTAAVTFDYLTTGVNIPIPAGGQVVGVELRVGKAWTGGTTLEVGDGTDPDGFLTAAQGAVANLTAGASLKAAGVFMLGATDVVAREFKTYAAADTIDVAYTGTFTAGTATLVVAYI